MTDLEKAVKQIESVDYDHTIGRFNYENEDITEVLEDFEILLD